jgi:glycosyltransferase involved in cell wall biosynthesis
MGARAIVIHEVDIGDGFFARCKALERSCYVRNPQVEAPRFFIRQAFEEIGEYDESLGSGEDWDIQQKVRAKGLVTAYISSEIRHHIEKIDLPRQIRKKYLYGLTFRRFIEKYPDVSRRLFIYYQLAYLKNLTKLMYDPSHALGMLFIRFLEVLAATLGVVSARLVITRWSYGTIRILPDDSWTFPDRDDLPSISVIIPTYNCSEMLSHCLRSITTQDYPTDKIEILVIDGGSEDNTIDVARAYNAKVIHAQQERENPEGRKAIGLQKSDNDILLYIDSDNILPHSKWLKKMLSPFLENREVVATQPLRYHHEPSYSLLNRYFALLGVSDPVVYYFNKRDKLSWAEEKWNLVGQARDMGYYYLVRFDPRNVPTLGANGFLIRKESLLRARCMPHEFFHIDVNQDLINLGLNTYGIVKDDVVHLTGASIASSISKRVTYMRYYHNLMNRRYKIYEPTNGQDKLKLGQFVLFSITLLRPAMDSVRGYKKLPDIAWFLHPVFCILVVLAYGTVVLGQELWPRARASA